MISTVIFSFRIFDAFSLLLVFIILYVSRYYYHYFTRPNPLPGPFPTSCRETNIQFEGAIGYKLQRLATFEWINELWNEVETYWNSLEEDYKLDLIEWMNRFTNEIILRISTCYFSL
ncbi:hypothetical protein RhiirA4_474027 [Rhizophagus irregularis]|uniref:Uncharacterized protein n=1 Tax=Rhizophagus irregularis TaxID=588596 RepID=A0A2I1H7S4_9GLOM|nr:hypothetical protein RhiirA4_474027 [Rhizophagus irregularis]